MQKLLERPVALVLILFALAYLPFLNSRMIKIHNDQAVYLGQVIEMIERGDWFFQTQFGNPYFHKGPVHYLLVHFGYHLFDLSLAATVYMNVILHLAGALLILRLVQRVKVSAVTELLMPAIYMLSIPLYLYCFVSQMEIELCFIYTLATYFLGSTSQVLSPGRTPTGGRLLFWLVCGFAGLIKSPLHSVFLGLSGLLFWWLDGSLPRQLKDIRFYLAAMAGICFCIIGFLPTVLSDPAGWWDSYIVQQSLSRTGFLDDPPINFILSTFWANLAPWVGPIFVGYIFWAKVLTRFAISRSSLKEIPAGLLTLAKLGLAILIPTVGYFMAFGHFAQWYGVPVVIGVICLTGAAWETQRHGSHDRWYFRTLWPLSGLLFLTVAVVITALYWTVLKEESRFEGLALASVFFLVTAITHLAFGCFALGWRSVTAGKVRLWLVTLGAVFSGFGVVSASVAEAELVDLRQKLADHGPKVGYLNLRQLNFSEFGTFQFTTGVRFQYIATVDEAQKALKDGVLLIADEKDYLLLLDRFPAGERDQQWDVTVWRRYSRKAQKFVRSWRESGWSSADMSLLERPFYLISGP